MLDVGSNFDNLGERFMTDDEMVLAWGWSAVLEGAPQTRAGRGSLNTTSVSHRP